jgi:pyruvate-formate lyase-activating enzyme
VLSFDEYFRNGSFCILPFIHQEKTFEGYHKICCYSNSDQSDNNEQTSAESFNSDTINSIRQHMIAGQRHSACQSCYVAEDQGLISPRQHENETWQRWTSSHPALEKAVANFNENQPMTPVSYDLRHSNTCTLKCRMCNSSSSSAINTEYKKIHTQWPEKFWFKDNPRTRHDIVIDSEIQKVYLAGGEPLVEPYNLELLSKLADTNPDLNIVINTSLNILNDRFLEVLNRFSCLTLAVSVDGVGSLNDYIRNGSDFNVVRSNIEKLRHHEILFTSCVSIYNIFGINNLAKFITDHYSDCIQYNISLVNDIPELFVENTPVSLRPKIISDLTDCLAWSLPRNANVGIKNLRTLLEQDNFVPERFESFRRYTKILDQHRGETVSAVVPELAPYFID